MIYCGRETILWLFYFRYFESIMYSHLGLKIWLSKIGWKVKFHFLNQKNFFLLGDEFFSWLFVMSWCLNVIDYLKSFGLKLYHQDCGICYIIKRKTINLLKEKIESRQLEKLQSIFTSFFIFKVYINDGRTVFDV